ncbi:MAG TPA: hypothetical protein VJS44_21120 [Pyrinomonadaceae bacterium]|nr:hypothetical protein [Pyrinomonadaceae bacterium]
MRLLKHISIITTLFCALALSLAACAPADNANSNTTATTNTNAPVASATPAAQNLTASTERPQGVKDKAAALGEADTASPKLRIAEPREGATIAGSTVRLKLNLTSDKGYKPGKDPATGMGPHIHVILDNQPYEAYYSLDQPFELRNVSEGKHTIRVFASRPWHESYKNDGSFQMVTFTVKGGGDASKPTTTNTGQVMANTNAGSNANAGAQAPAEGKDFAASTAGDVDPKKPLLTYSRPKGEYKGADADPIMIDFWLSNAKLAGDGGEYRVRYSVDGGEAKMLDKWQPIWLSGWTSGKHTVKLELVDKSGNVVANGDYNSTTREITVQK